MADLVQRAYDAANLWRDEPVGTLLFQLEQRIEALEKEREQWFSADELAREIRFARREALEEAARVAEVYQDPRGYGDYASDVIAARIRALKEGK